MTFCRELGMTYTEFLEQPADVMLKWRQYLSVEAKAAEMRRKTDEHRIKSRSLS